MKGRMNTQMGEITIDNDVLAKYAGSSAVECFGVVGMASVNMKDGIVKLLKRDNLSHGVNVTLEDNKITIDLHIIVSYGVSISAVADNLISNVKYNVEEFSGLEVQKINIFVEGVRVID
ncbi:MAG: Asp23/Gls24 family envelope stress response protein [Clostridiales bacterium]|nr:Asp23/Gls24 family envelope stress response protein [Clostridiales bacterium]